MKKREMEVREEDSSHSFPRGELVNRAFPSLKLSPYPHVSFFSSPQFLAASP